jgi:hypothetical protein
MFGNNEKAHVQAIESIQENKLHFILSSGILLSVLEFFFSLHSASDVGSLEYPCFFHRNQTKQSMDFVGFHSASEVGSLELTKQSMSLLCFFHRNQTKQSMDFVGFIRLVKWVLWN